MGSWHTDNFDKENLSFTVSSARVRSKNKYFQNRHVVLITRWEEIANKEFCQNCVEKVYLNELLQITWCVYAKQKYGKAVDLKIASYAHIFDFSFDFDTMLIENGWSKNFGFVSTKFRINKNYRLTR